MSFTDQLVIWLHVAFVIFTIGPVSIAILSSPRYIRHRNVAVLRYLLRMTRIFGAASLGVLVFGIVAAQQLNKFKDVWVTAAMTLFVVSLVLLVLIMRDQRKAVIALETAAEHEALATANTGSPGNGDDRTQAADAPDAADAQAIPLGSPAAAVPHAASVERGRIASIAGIVTLIWLVILVLMVWQPT